MSKKAFTLLLGVFTALLFLFAITPAFAEEFTGNKCYDEWECGDGSTDESAYWWEAGWCAAALESGFVSVSVADCTSSPDDDVIIIFIEEDEDGKTSRKRSITGLKAGCYSYDLGEGLEAGIDWDGGKGPSETNIHMDLNCEDEPLGSNTLTTDASKLSCEEPLFVTSVTLNNGKKIYFCGDE